MRAPVTRDGLLIPKRMLRGVKEAEIRKEQGRIVVLPVPGPRDPIFRLGRKPVRSGVRDGSVRHDAYLCPHAKTEDQDGPDV